MAEFRAVSDEQLATRANLDEEFMCLLEDAEVDVAIIKVLRLHKVTSMKRFAAIGSNVESVRSSLAP